MRPSKANLWTRGDVLVFSFKLAQESRWPFFLCLNVYVFLAVIIVADDLILLVYICQNARIYGFFVRACVPLGGGG